MSFQNRKTHEFVKIAESRMKRQTTNSSIAPYAEKLYSENKRQIIYAKGGLVCRKYKSKKQRKIRVFNRRNRQGNIIPLKPAKMTISCSTLNRGTNRTPVAKKHKHTVRHSILNDRRITVYFFMQLSA